MKFKFIHQWTVYDVYVKLRPADYVLPVNNFLCKFPVLKNYKGNFTYSLTATGGGRSMFTMFIY